MEKERWRLAFCSKNQGWQECEVDIVSQIPIPVEIVTRQ